jgi:hypothetical protein
LEYSGDIRDKFVSDFIGGQLVAFAVSEAGPAGVDQAGLAYFPDEDHSSSQPHLQIVQSFFTTRSNQCL